MDNKTNDLFLNAFLILFFSVLISFVFFSCLPVDGKSITTARELGIISLTTLSGYSKNRESQLYIITLAVTFLLSVFAALTLGKKAEDKTDGMAILKTPAIRGMEFVILLPAVILLTYNTNFFYTTWLNHYTFFSEEGQHLSYTINLFHGKIPYRDTYIIYGPLMEYPLYFMMKLLGKNIVVARLYTYLLDLTAFILLYLFLRRVLQRIKTAAAVTLLFIIFYFPLFPSPNGSIMRVSSGFIPLLLLSFYNEHKRNALIFLSGCSSILVFFFSQEIGLASLIASLFFLLYTDLIDQGNLRKSFLSLSYFFLGAFIGAFPFIIFLASTGALGEYINQTFSYPYYVTLGLGNIPFPDIIGAFLNFSAHPGKESLSALFRTSAYYWPMVLYLFLIPYFMLQHMRGEKDKLFPVMVSTLLFGIIVMRGAISRAGLDRNYLMLPPAIIISFFFIEKNILGLIQRAGKRKILLSQSIFTIFLLCGIVYYGAVPASWSLETFSKSIYSKLFKASFEFPVDPQMEKIGLKETGDVRIPLLEAKRIKFVTSYVKERLQENESIFVFPNDATYYFLLDLPMPARFGVLHDAATRLLKIQIVEDLKKNKPRFIINTEAIWQVDKIPEQIEFAEIKSYIDTNYLIVAEYEGLKILEPLDHGND